ncbi:hypothetical protein [Frigoriglobus tundricola]|uniref:Lipocalin-like domain-containing protein n=1 Tax=Frigoriglobus tundricola TaxID=2774151 RepID=A0A6M5YI14_9BACT|nr:hypothetical protein [Frigoriglobus tundricola]QJW93685.1 hypothetical protein FTUN_1193 [Frigoriglobus tundricola]
MRILIGCVVILALAFASAGADDKKDKKDKKDTKPAEISADKLIGKWITPAPKSGPGAAEFQKNAGNIPAHFFKKDGKYAVGPASGKGPNIEGTYTLEGDKLTITFPANAGSPEEVHKRVIKKLTDTELVYVEGKQTTSLKKDK